MNDKRKRAAPTIDLTATELSSAPAEPASKHEPPPEPDTEPPTERAAQAQPPPSQPPPPQKPAPVSGLGMRAAAIAGGLAGAALVAAVFAALWYSGLLPASFFRQSGAQIANLQKQIHDLQNRPPPTADTHALDALRTRVAGIEHDIVKLPPGDKTVAERLASADNAMKSLGVALAALNKRSDDTAAVANAARERAAAAEKAVVALRASVQNAAKTPAIEPARLEALQKRAAALEVSVTAVRAQIAKTAVIDGPARLALSAAALRDAVTSGAPYAAELAQAKTLGADAKALAPLMAFAGGGVPSRAALARELTGLMPALLKATGAQQAPAGFLERLQANAGRLVRISPVSAPAGGKPADVLARIEVEAAQADIAAALADLGKLPAAARAPAQGWIDKAKARQAALAAARQLASAATRALGQK